MGSVLSHLVETEAQVGLARELGRSKSLDTGVIDQLERVQCLLQVLNKLPPFEVCLHHILRILAAVWPPPCQVRGQHTWNGPGLTRNIRWSLNGGLMLTPPTCLLWRTSYCLEVVWWQLLCMWRGRSAGELRERSNHTFCTYRIGSWSSENLWSTWRNSQTSCR